MTTSSGRAICYYPNRMKLDIDQMPHHNAAEVQMYIHTSLFSDPQFGKGRFDGP